jgi:hypothetical protein
LPLVLMVLLEQAAAPVLQVLMVRWCWCRWHC